MNSTLSTGSAHIRDIVLDRFSQPPPFFMQHVRKMGVIGALFLLGGATLVLVGTGAIHELGFWWTTFILGAIGLTVILPLLRTEQNVRVRIFYWNPLSPELMRTRIEFIDLPFKNIAVFVSALQRRTEGLGPAPESLRWRAIILFAAALALCTLGPLYALL